jgi:hypothetical protein
MLTDPQRRELIAQIRELPAQLAELVRGLSPQQLTTAYLPGEWTVAQNVHHLADSHMNCYVRCKLIATEDNPPLKPYDQDVWARFDEATGADLGDSLALLRGLHARWTVFWERLPAEAWGRTGTHPERGVVSLDDLLQSYAEHGLGHLDQIQRTLAAAPRGT